MRNKLIELIHECEVEALKSNLHLSPERIADYLLSNGVHLSDQSRFKTHFVEVPKELFVLNPITFYRNAKYNVDCIPINSLQDFEKYTHFYGYKNIFFTREEAEIEREMRERGYKDA